MYLDYATTSPMPASVREQVMAAIDLGGGAGRSVHRRGQQATEAYEAARRDVASSLAVDAPDVVFVASCTAGLNAVAQGWGDAQVGPRDEIVVTLAEHHSNLLPWRALAQRAAATVRVVACDAGGDIDLADLKAKLSPRTRIVAVTHVSNVTGAVTPVADIAALIRASGNDAVLVVDGAQAVAHLEVHPADLGCDFYVFSGHKTYGPLGAGVLWARPERWDETRPWRLGGGMVDAVTDADVVLATRPARYEAGSPNVAAAVGLAAGLRFAREAMGHGRAGGLALEAAEALEACPGVTVLGAPKQRVGAVSFNVDGVHAHDVGTLADERGIALRVGHHCAQPYLRHFGVSAAVRASFGADSRPDHIAALLDTVSAARSLFRPHAGGK